MSKCPNCFAQLDKDGVCPACGYQSAAKVNNVEKLLEEGKFLEAKAILDEALAKDTNDGKANLLMTRVLTKNFGEKPENVDQLKEYAVKGLTYASEKDKALIDYKLLSYFENLNLGGRGVSDVFDIKASIVGGGYATDASGKPVGATGHFSEGGAAPAAGASKVRKPLSKKAKIILLAILGVGVVGATVGIIVSTTGGKHSGGSGKGQQDTSYTYVTFDKQGGSGGTSSTTNTYGSSYYSISVPTKSGYTFSGYYTSTSGYGTKYYDQYGNPTKSSWDISSSSYTLYAYWTSSATETYVTFNKGSGSGGDSYAYNTYGQPYDKVVIPTKSGYTFSGYYTSSYGWGTKYYDEYGNPFQSTWDIYSSSYTLYAYWTSSPTPMTQTYVTFDKQGGSGGTSSTTNTYGSSYYSISVPTKSGYTFSGYYTSTSGYGTKYYDQYGNPTKSSWDISSSSYTLYAYWTSSATETYVTFNKGSGSGGDSYAYNTYGQPYDKVVIPTKSGYTFSGYYTESGGYGTKYYDQYGDSAKSTWDLNYSSYTLYAYWTSEPSKTYSIVREGTYGYTLDTASNPDSSLYDGVYVSTNYGVHNSESVAKVTFSGYSSFTIYYRSNGESNYDYLYISSLDASSYSSGSCLESTRGYPSSSSYSHYTFSCSTDEHSFYVSYRKDSSDSSGTDRGYFYILK